MSEERLSKLQKWILIATYRVMILCDRTELTLKICNHYSKDLCIKNHTKGECNDICKRELITGRSCYALKLYKEDILLDYYHFKITRKRTSLFKLVCFEDNGENNKAHVAVKRSLESLEKKGYVNLYYSPISNYIATLTEKGKNKSKELIN